MGIDYNKIYEVINKSKAGVVFDEYGSPKVRDSMTVQGIPVADLEEITEMINSETLASLKNNKSSTEVLTMQEVRKRVVDNTPKLLSSFSKRQKDSIVNPSFGIGTLDDTTTHNWVRPNIWISPFEAASLYSQKGILENVINKKAKSILLNGLKIKNPRLSAKELDKVAENAVRLDIPSVITSSVLDALVYGGNLLFPVFKKDNPYTYNLPFNSLIKLGVLGKHCISRFISLDRWNTWIIPPVNPTQKDFLEPSRYFIPYMGVNVSRERSARIVTSPQSGWWGKMVTQGWGISDFCGYYASYEQYKIVMQALPFMIQQMSILVRSVNVDAILATSGANVLEDVMSDNLIKTRRATAENPINVDIIGNLTAINRDFGGVPDLIKLLRQGFAADAQIPEPMLFSSEKGNFSSGDDTQGNMEKQWESVKYIHKTVEVQLRKIAAILLIDTFGATKKVMEAIPYTTIHFDSPVIANASDKAEISERLSKSFFNLVGGRMPMDIAAEIAFSYAGGEQSLSSDILDELKQVQEKQDELALVELESKQNGSVGNERTTTKKDDNNSSKNKYDPLEQKQHERIAVGKKRSEMLSKARGKLE